jgi:dTDP-4-dehydrorhamnose 3,5-epimerase
VIVLPQRIPGVALVRAEPNVDARGFFVRLYSADELVAQGIPELCSQISLSHNTSTHTLRGLHYQREPHAEVKLVRCVAGAIFDVVVDMREASPTFGESLSVVLTRESLEGLIVPEGGAHGFLTLEPDTDILYQMSTRFVPGAAAGIRWDDPALGIAWPQAPAVISDGDRALPTLAEALASAGGHA